MIAPFVLSYWSITPNCGPYAHSANKRICTKSYGKPCPHTILWDKCKQGTAIKKDVHGIDVVNRLKPGQRGTKIGGCEYYFLAIYVCSSGGTN